MGLPTRFVATASTACFAFACSASTGTSFSPQGVQGTGGASSAGGAPVTPAAGGVSGLAPTGSQGGSQFLMVTTPSGTAGVGGMSSCAATSSAAERVVTTTMTQVTMPAPVAVYIMQDQSLSMLGPKWQSVQQAIQQFTTNPMSAGMDVAIKFFAGATANLFDCTGADYQTPDVPIAPLPMNAQAINDSVNMHGPSSLTPIEPALRGGIDFCEMFEANHPMEKCVLVFITDGTPDLCDGSSTDLAMIASDGAAKGVPTFTVGMDGADFNMLNAIAVGGGTDCTPQTMGGADQACDVRGGTQAFVDALNTIRGTISTTVTQQHVETTALACEFEIPKPPDGMQFDRTKVNVRLTVMGTPTDFSHVMSAADCANFGDQGWYYDDNDNPTKIEVCNSTCATIKAATGDDGTTTTATPVGDAPRVDVLLGCATQEAVR
ncbi:MAG TPA: vWA domain-containing protein [Polyangiaceae bacterium]|nr:vWA domain-containing protein [Polyangiaceae bacterium]